MPVDGFEYHECIEDCKRRKGCDDWADPLACECLCVEECGGAGNPCEDWEDVEEW